MKKTALLIALCAAPLASQAAPADPKQAYIDSTFTAMDTNKDGRVDKAEYTRFQQGRFSKQADSIDAAFSAMDTNKDGRISKDEATLVPEIAKYFAGLDTDGDGYLSLKEMQQAMVAAQTADAPAR
ncbi:MULTISPECIES: EF-hand domain-containing protein [Stenotrophomonas]|jgi:Ca2+-binding EF-hand superfamily protein|uniref:EF-hand domain-containing protein n=1 Tax=Stenotrophomonas maltophilia TaxID=40324 RepID=A0AA40Y8V6_STEMA|nr:MULTISPECIES: EF-hand domain-containing protein [Stenotrophomonas]AWB78911.1 histidine kinase [Stenotrophomonas maltophilia]KDE91252.1 histidine kinase [Stenotrophomonas maltophilia M30]CCH13194.1 putative signal transduction protein with EFhand domain [Stenotrophomonas maltophilia D457]KKF87407.1 histidine kinase [Stenotrophomonas maltophilia]KLN99670.1 histidine kinase [Stenotrophomonas maltophilia]